MKSNIETQALKIWRGVHPRAQFARLCTFSLQLSGEVVGVRRGSGLLGRSHLLLADGRACPCYRRTNSSGSSKGIF
jgi:hypothetical protein